MILEKAKIYGVDGIGREALVRTDASLGLSWRYGANGEIHSDFDPCFPWSDMREVFLDVGVFVRIPKFYSKITVNSDGTYKVQISGYRYDGFSTLFLDGEGNELDYVLVGKYEASGPTSEVFSRLDSRSCHRLSALSLDKFRDAARISAAYVDGAQLYDVWIDAMIKQLFMVEFATTDCQSVMAGWTNSSNTAALSSGHTDYIKTPSGSYNRSRSNTSKSIHKDGYHACKYRGIENPWGNMMCYCDGIFFDEEKIYIGTDPSGYADQSNTIYAGDRFVCDSEGEETINRVTPLARMPFLFFVTDAKEGGVYADGYSARSLECNRMLVGGSWNDGDSAGLWNCHLETGRVDSNRFGTRLCIKPILK